MLRAQEPKKAMAGGGWNWEKKGGWDKKGDAGKGDKEKKEWKGAWALEDDQQLAVAARASLEVQQATLQTMQQLVPLPIFVISAVSRFFDVACICNQQIHSVVCFSSANHIICLIYFYALAGCCH